MVRLTDRPDMTLDVYRGRKTTMQQQQVLPVHRKRGFITSSNSEDADQLLHLRSHISVFSIFASRRYHENHTNGTGKELTLLGCAG